MAATPQASHKATMAFISQQYNSSRTMPSAQLIREPRELERFFHDVQIKSAAAQNLLPNIDFNNDVLLAVSMGQKPTEGYKLSFDSSKTVDVYPDHIAVQVVWSEPVSATVQRTATHPCVLIKFAKGQYTRIKVYDQSKKLRYVANL